MYLSGESLLIILLVGLIAGWLAGKLVAGGGFGLIGDIAIGIVGGFIGSWLLPRLGIHVGAGVVSKIIVATIGSGPAFVHCRHNQRRLPTTTAVLAVLILPQTMAGNSDGASGYSHYVM